MNCERAAVGETDGYSTDDNDEPDGPRGIVISPPAPHASSLPVRRRDYNFPQCGWNCCQPGTLPQRRRNLARSETDATRGHAA
jgi:hypothetical protein